MVISLSNHAGFVKKQLPLLRVFFDESLVLHKFIILAQHAVSVSLSQQGVCVITLFFRHNP